MLQGQFRSLINVCHSSANRQRNLVVPVSAKVLVTIKAPDQALQWGKKVKEIGKQSEPKQESVSLKNMNSPPPPTTSLEYCSPCFLFCCFLLFYPVFAFFPTTETGPRLVTVVIYSCHKSRL